MDVRPSRASTVSGASSTVSGASSSGESVAQRAIHGAFYMVPSQSGSYSPLQSRLQDVKGPEKTWMDRPLIAVRESAMGEEQA